MAYFLVLLFSIIFLAYMCRHLIFTYYALFNPSARVFSERIAGSYLPTVSLLVPAYNEETVIGYLLERVTQLTYPKDRMEVLVIDDGSKDRTGEIADQFAERYQ